MVQHYSIINHACSHNLERRSNNYANMLTKQEIRNYYKTTQNLVLLPNSQFRQYKFFDGKRWIILKKKIRTVEELREQLIKHAPIEAFWSVSLFLNPERIEFRKQSSITDKLFLSSTGFLDFDSRDGDLEQVKKDVSKAYMFLKGRDYKGLKLVFSGRGFHLYFKLNGKTAFGNPEHRMRYYKALKMKLLQNLEHLDLKTLDYGTSIDIFRISRIIGSLHNNGQVCREVTSSLHQECKASNGGQN